MARDVQVKKRPGKVSKKQRDSADARRYAAEYGYTQREWRRINEQDARERRAVRRLGAVMLVLLAAAAVLGYLVWYTIFRSHDYNMMMEYDSASVYALGNADLEADLAKGFAEDLCVVDSDQNTDMLALGALSAGLFDLTDQKVLYAKDIYSRRSPASLTKIMTALTAIKYGRLDDIVTVTDTALDIEYGSSVCDIRPGDQLSLRQLLYGLLIASGNDAAMMIAEHVGGSVDAFVELMNREAASIGATRTHFVNPHGLTAEDHYTCLYDLYLMFREAMNSDVFMDIISRKNYYAEYRREDGTAAAVTWESTIHYFTGEAALPDDIIIYGGKTGTTDDAGACLFVLAKDLYGNPYIGGIMHAADKDVLYSEMNGMLSLVFYL